MYESPLSGDVLQDIVTFWTLPWKWFLSSSNQFGFVNINTMESSDPELEEDVVKNVASYGKQLGRIVECLEVVTRKPELKDLDSSEEKAVKEFQYLAERIDDRKMSRGRSSRAPRIDEIEQLLESIRYVRKNRPDIFEKLLKELHE
ncbi:MAG: hypothetical protein ACLGPL_10675 [Acidobacteriota bacterium]